MNKTKQEEREKEFIFLSKKRSELWGKIRRAEITTLAAPYQNGWKLSLRIRDDVYNSEKGPLMLDALKLCTVEVKKYSPELISKLRTKKSWNDLQDLLTHSYKSYDGKIYTVYTGPELKSLSVKKFNAIDERLKKFFDYNCKETVSKWGGQVHKEESYSLNIPKYTIEVRVKKNMVTQMKKIDPEVVSEYTKIDAILNSYFRDFQGGRSSWYGFKDKYELKRQRRHSNDAIAKIKSGEIDDTQQYHKLNKLKKRV